jgi:hypothetical protein
MACPIMRIYLLPADTTIMLFIDRARSRANRGETAVHPTEVA